MAGDTASSNGGGIYNAGNLTVIRSLVAGNTASSNGGGIYSPATATALAISNSTLANNIATSQGGALGARRPQARWSSPRWRATAPQPAAGCISPRR